MFTLRPARSFVRNLLKRPNPALEAVAEKSWEISAGNESFVPPAIFLPGQLDRVTGTVFSSPDWRRWVEGNFIAQNAPTKAYLLKDALFSDGVVYTEKFRYFAGLTKKKLPPLTYRQVYDRGAVYSTQGGIQYFGQWLLDDCLTYPLAAAEGLPVTTVNQLISSHLLDYEDFLGMKPLRVDSARFKELVIFQDFGQNPGKLARARGLIEQLQKRFPGQPHPGVFLLRGLAGHRRYMINELEVADHLQKTRGYKILDPMTMSLPELLQECSGAKMVLGVEGSHLIHGVMMQNPGDGLFIFQPPARFCTVFKDVAARNGQPCGMVVGKGTTTDFVVDLDEVDRTLDLMDKAKVQERAIE